MPKIRVLFSLIFFIILLPKTRAQTDSTVTKKDTLDYYEMSLEQLLKMKAHGVPSELEKLINSLISVASKKPLNTRESPSIVSLITEEEIKKSGARDLIDVLRLVPGFDFGVDVEGAVGLGIRGNWSHEGKVLVLIDGQESNEILYACTFFGNHYPIDQIKKIEIIRGPGSAIYGGFAEYGVINIITRQGEDINGMIVSGTYGQMENTYGRRNANLSIGQKINDLQYSVSGMIGQGQRSDQVLRDTSSTYNMAGNSNLDPKYLNAAISWKGLSARFIGDFYRTKIGMRATFINPSGPYYESFSSLYGELKYVIKVNDKITLTPKLNIKQQKPWHTTVNDSVAEGGPYDVTAYRSTGNLTGSFNLNRYVNFVAGGEIYQDRAYANLDTNAFSSDTTGGVNTYQKYVSYYNFALFGQGLIKTRLVNIVLGARYDKHNVYGDAFVPRVGLTKKIDRFHFKALYSQSFRAPTIENIHYAYGDIHPERTQVAELELGYQLSRKSIFTINVYDITTTRPIVYFFDTINNNDGYANYGKGGTQGIEAEYRRKAKWGYFTLNYSYYSAANKEKVDRYVVDGSSASLLAFANHRINMNASYTIVHGLSINPSFSYMSPRWGYAPSDTAKDVNDLKLFDPVFLINLFLRYDAPVKGLSIGAGVYDLLNQKPVFLQPYNSDHPPLPGPSREFIFKLSYTLNYKKKTG